MLSAAIIASVPAAASLANTVIEQVREGSQSFAATLSHALQSQTGPPPASSPSSFSEALQDLADILQPPAARLSPSGTGVANAEPHDALGQLRELIRERLLSAGIDDLQGIELELRPSDGRLAVVSDHPDKARIEAILNDKSTSFDGPKLADAVAQWASSATTLRFRLDASDAPVTFEGL